MEIYAVFEWGGGSFRMIAAYFFENENVAREAALAAFARHRETHGFEVRGLPPAMGEVLRCSECDYGVVALTLERD